MFFLPFQKGMSHLTLKDQSLLYSVQFWSSLLCFNNSYLLKYLRCRGLYVSKCQVQALVCPLSAYERDNGKGRNGAHSAVRFLSSFTLRVKAGDCNHLCPDRVSVHRRRNSEVSADSLNFTSYAKSITVFTMYTVTSFACLKWWLEYQLPPSSEKKILNEFAKQQKMFKTVNFGDMIKMNYRIIITFCFFKAPLWKHKWVQR